MVLGVLLFFGLGLTPNAGALKPPVLEQVAAELAIAKERKDIFGAAHAVVLNAEKNALIKSTAPRNLSGSARVVHCQSATKSSPHHEVTSAVILTVVVAVEVAVAVADTHTNLY